MLIRVHEYLPKGKSSSDHVDHTKLKKMNQQQKSEFKIKLFYHFVPLRVPWQQKFAIFYFN